MPDNLGRLGELTHAPDTNIIKLPNISASVPQLLAAIKELQAKGYDLPDYPGDPKSDEEREIKERYAKALGSAVNPVLRQGNSDRRAPKAVKEYARKHPHSMGQWSQASRTRGDHARRRLLRRREVDDARSRSQGQDGADHQGRRGDGAQAGGGARRGRHHRQHVHEQKALCEFYEREMQDAYETGVMFSLHVKATMMKVSHPIVFGHAVKVFYKEAFAKHEKLFDELGVNVNNGMSDLYDKIESLPARSARRSSTTSTPATSTGPNSRWWIRRAASLTSIRPAT